MGAGMRNQPKASSSADSSGVPQTRQMIAEQSPQVRGSFTGRAQAGHQNVVGKESCAFGFFVSGMWIQRSSGGEASSSGSDRTLCS